MTGTLFVVATPIGNLEDITLRALRILREAHVIAAEDTRRTGRLLAHFGINVPTVSFHEHNSRSRVPHLMARLESGENVALVSDAGTPSVSDPGLELVQACIAGGIAIDPIPGPSAALAAAVASGFPLDPFTIHGFPPARSKDRVAWLQSVSEVPHSFCFFEAPHRVAAALVDIHAVLGDRQIAVAHELTKVHQSVLRGTAKSVSEQLGTPKGEFTILVGPAEPAAATAVPEDVTLGAEFRHLTERAGLDRRKAIAQISRTHQMPSRDVYAAIERIKNAV
jgi:16S rRNA (cytidine1402-2'-O)-methyltransferase